MIDTLANGDPLDDLAEEFARRWRNGEQPSIEEYAARFPDWADRIRELFPAVLLMERLKPQVEETPTARRTPDVGRPPEQLGEYRLLREIGRGGMGVVYEARQEPLGRRVALKVLPSQLLTNDKLRLRFRRESQAAGRLHHTNIVPVFGVGEQDGVCFYIMQLISGRSIDTLLADAQPQQPPFSPRDVARIGVQAAEALAYAHGQGVLHRDVKPSNLLLDDAGTVWVTDFGVAKLIEEVNLTQSGELVGTLKYMPPERFVGKSDARGDVYSLGITLYEMLARRPAFPDTTPQHLLQLIPHTDPPRLRTIDPTLPADLETVVLKAIARDPAHRYATASELADDLRRFLDDRPVLARRIGPLGQFWRWCRRNRVVAALTVAAIGLLLITTAVSVTAYVRTAAAGEKMRSVLAAEQEQRQRAEATSASALEALNRIYDRLAPNRIVVVPTPVTEEADEEGVHLPPQPILSPETTQLLEELLGSYEQFARDGGDYPKLQAQAAEANQRIGDIRQRLGQYESAISAYRKAIELQTHLSAEARSGSSAIRIARTYNELGRALRALQRIDEVREAHARALRTLTEAAAESGDRPEHRFELARTYYFQSQREFPSGPGGPDRGPPGGPNGFGPGRPPPPPGPPRGEPPHPGGSDNGSSRRAIVLLEDLVKEHPSVPEYRHLLACCYRDSPPDRGRPPGPGANTNRAVELLRQLVKDYPKVPDYRYDLCETLARASFFGRPPSPDTAEASRQMLEEALAISQQLVTEYPNVPQYTASGAQVRDRLGQLLHHTGRSDEAEKMLRKAVALQTELVRQHADVTAYRFSLSLTQAALARVLTTRGNTVEARQLLETLSVRLERLLQSDPRLGFVRGLLIRSRRELAGVLTQLGERDLAAQALRKADELERQQPPQEPGPRPRPVPARPPR